jgi:2-hydroxychromene-2-carboxylate isomerase
MTEKFKEQGGAATMDPHPLLRLATSRLMSRISKPAQLEKKRRKAERARLKEGRAHVIEYFHQVEDGYSHLAAQILSAMVTRYDITLICHLVRGPKGNNAPEPELLLRLSRYDAQLVAPEYGLEFPAQQGTPAHDVLHLAGCILAGLDDQTLPQHAHEVGQALWQSDAATLAQIAATLGQASDEVLAGRLDEGDARLQELKHYSGAMFYYAGEWYWGVDRLYHLEKRLAALGADHRPSEAQLMPRPDIETGPLQDDGRLTLEIYPSLRSPYTAISFDRTVELARATGVKLDVRPVLPMVMRGVPATRQKGMYIFSDTAREAREASVPYGNFYDPIGEPTRRGYSLYPWACEQGRGSELLSAFLSCAFTQGVNIGTDKGLKKVVLQAGLDWSDAQTHIGQPGWEAVLERNRQSMYDSGLWGVPSFRLIDDQGQVQLALWGQDRLWLIARYIQRALQQRPG